MKKALAQKLSQFVPEGTELLCAHWLIEGNIQLKITPPRKTKLGDFRPATRTHPHRISVNSDLSPLQFLITFTHEVAHAHNWDKHGRKVAPHGSEWKRTYGSLLRTLVDLNTLTPEAAEMLYQHSLKPKASSARDSSLAPVRNTAGSKVVDDLSPGTEFQLSSGRSFRTIRRLRKYWLCVEPISGKHYRVHGTAPISSIK